MICGMKKINISCHRIPGLFFIVDDNDYEKCMDRHWNMGSRYPHFASGLEDKRRHNPVHTLLMAPPPGLVVDHLDGDVFNNTRSNLEICTAQENYRRMRQNAWRYLIKGVRFSDTLQQWCVYHKRANNYRLCSIHKHQEDAIAHKMDLVNR